MPNLTEVDAWTNANQLDRCVVTHSDFDRAYRGVLSCMARSGTSREPACCAVLGPSGMGKSLVAKAIRAAYPPTEEVVGTTLYRRVPTFYTSLEAPTDVRALPLAMLGQLGVPCEGSHNLGRLTGLIKTGLANARTQLAFIDEFHDLINHGRNATTINRRTTGWVKGLTNDSKTAFCIVGLPECETIISGDPELARRFAYIYRLRPLSLGVKDAEGPIGPYLRELRSHALKNCGVADFPSLDDFSLLLRIFVATSGYPGYISLLIKEAIAGGLMRSSGVVTVDHLSDAFESGTCRTVSRVQQNPFTLPENALYHALRAHA